MMAGWKRRILGVTVISAGVCAALPFRNDNANSPVGTRAAAELLGSEASRAGELTLQLTIPSGPSPAPTDARPSVVTPAVLQATTSLQSQEVVPDDLRTPPPLPSSFETFAGEVKAVLDASEPSSGDEEPERRHRIADGDTLEAIAERYLGSRSEWRSIFSHNEGVLADPAILPIGEEIRIPPTSTRSSHHDDRLVPIPAGLLNRE